MKDKKRGVSLWWTFVPIFLGFVGGLVAWRFTRHRHEEMARVLLALGIVFTLVIIPFYLWLMSVY